MQICRRKWNFLFQRNYSKNQVSLAFFQDLIIIIVLVEYNHVDVSSAFPEWRLSIDL